MTGRKYVWGFTLMVVFAVGLVGRAGYSVVSVAGAGLRDVPPQVVANAYLARERMERIVQAVAAYQNEFYPQLPPRLSALYPQYISDPLVFWHPGDSDPPPTTIDNDVPNAPNSALISFDIELTGGWNWPGNRSYIRDNNPANNGGLFVNENWGVWYTEPPGLMPSPTAMAVARSHLHGLAMALSVYANDNYGWWPADALQLTDAVGPPEYARRAFWHPGDDQPMPTAITNSVLNGLDSAQISYEYLVAGLNENYYDPGLAVFRDNTPANNGGFGTLVSYCDGHVEYVPVCPGDATGELQVDFGDFLVVADNLGRWETANPWQGDLNGDSDADLRDVAVLQLHFGDVCR